MDLKGKAAVGFVPILNILLMLGLGAGEEQALFNGQMFQYSGTTVDALSPRGYAFWISLSEKFLKKRVSPPHSL